MTMFWPDCGYAQLARDAGGRLVVTDGFLRGYLERPELALVEASCANERDLHARLVAAPRLDVAPAMLDGIADADARENYGVFLRFRDQLLAAPTLEAFYARLFTADVSVPPVFIDGIVQAILRGMLDDCDDGVTLRAAEIFFRRQKANVVDGAIMLADADTVERHALDGGFGRIGELLRSQATPVRSLDLDVLKPDNAQLYFLRDGRHDFALQLNGGHPGNTAFCTLIERWIAHFHGVAVSVRPVREIPDEDWVWHVGLDAEATAILNDVYEGRDVDAERMRRIIALLRLEFADPADMRAEIAGKPVFLALATTPGGEVRMKPQNLVVNLPLARRA